jgi:CheY-like chemotaxis protein
MYAYAGETLGGDRVVEAAARAGASTNRTVLVADDDVDFREALAETLRAEGHDVLEVGSGEAAIASLDRAAKAGTRLPDLVVLDLLMPRMSGLEVLRRIRRSASAAQLPVLVVTGVNDPMLPVRLDASVAFKPDVESIVETIRRQLAPDTRVPLHSSANGPTSQPARIAAPLTQRPRAYATNHSSRQ